MIKLSELKSLGTFKKNVLVLMSGTLVAQAIPIAISPILSRIYTPDEFGLLGLYLAICTLLSVIASGRYDLSLIEAKHDSDAKLLLIASVILTSIFSVVVLILAIFFNDVITDMLGNEDISVWLYLAPVTVFTLSCYSIFIYWLNRKKRFKDMSTNRIINSSSNMTISLSLGLLKFTSGGLIVGLWGGQIITVSLLWKKVFKERFEFNKKRVFAVMKKYSRYPKYLIPATFAGEASGHVPIILLTTFFNSATTGFLALTNRVTVLPMSFIGNAVGEVYRQKAAEEYNEFGNCRKLFLKTLLVLCVIAIIPFLVLFLFSVPLFTFVFGDEWVVAGEMAKYMSFVVFFQLISTPLSYTIVFNKSQKYDMYLQIFRAVFAVLSIVIGYINESYMLGVMLYSCSYSIYYIAHSILQYRAASGYKTKLKV